MIKNIDSLKKSLEVINALIFMACKRRMLAESDGEGRGDKKECSHDD